MEADILRALRSHLIVFAQSRSLPIAFTNRAFDAPADDKFLTEALFPNGTVRVGVSDLNSSAWRGRYLVAVFWPLNVGQTEAMELSAAVAAHFSPAGRLRSGAAVVRIVRHPEVSPFIVEDARIMIPVEVTWEVAG